MRKLRIFTNEEKDLIKELYEVKKYGIHKVAKELGTSTRKVSIVLDELGITRHSKGHRSFSSPKSRGSDIKSYLYGTWVTMKSRCYTPTATSYDTYGAKGVTVCDRWKNSFLDFEEDIHNSIGVRPEGHSLDRINTLGNYEPGNVRWASHKEQNQNRTSTKLTPDIVRAIRQERQSGVLFKELAKKCNISPSYCAGLCRGEYWKNVA